MANPDPQPWSPDPSNGIGTIPTKGSGGTGGERGSSSFAGNSLFNANGTRKPGTAARGPDVGTSYHTDGVNVVTGIGTNVFGESSKQGETLTVTNAASSTTPVHATPVTFTATLHPTAADEPSGNVEFREGSTVLGTAQVTAPGDTAVYVHQAGFAAGAHTIVARFTGDNNYPQTDSSGLVVTAS